MFGPTSSVQGVILALCLGVNPDKAWRIICCVSIAIHNKQSNLFAATLPPVPLNTVSWTYILWPFGKLLVFPCHRLNPGLLTCKANALPLSYGPSPWLKCFLSNRVISKTRAKLWGLPLGMPMAARFELTLRLWLWSQLFQNRCCALTWLLGLWQFSVSGMFMRLGFFLFLLYGATSEVFCMVLGILRMWGSWVLSHISPITRKPRNLSTLIILLAEKGLCSTNNLYKNTMLPNLPRLTGPGWQFWDLPEQVESPFCLKAGQPIATPNTHQHRSFTVPQLNLSK